MKRVFALLIGIWFFSLPVCAQTVYGIWEDQNSVYRFISIDGTTGAKTNISVIPSLTGYVAPGTSTINTKNNEYIFRGLHNSGTTFLYTIDLVTGAVLNFATFSQNVVGLEYNYVNDTLYGLYEDTQGRYNLVWINTSTGAITTITALAGVSSHVGGTFSLNTKDSLYQFVGLSGTALRLFGVHIRSGQIVYNNPFPSNVHAMRYNCGNDSLYGRWEDSSGVYNLVSVDISTGNFTVVDSLAGISSGYISEVFALNEDSAAYLFLGFKGNNTHFVHARVSDASVVASPAFNYTRMAGFETFNCALPPPKPKAYFTSSYLDTICLGDTIVFRDSSSHSPTALSWTFPGGKPYTSSDTLVRVVYDTVGTFGVHLKATNAAGSGDTIAPAFIVVQKCTPRPMAVFKSTYDDSICAGDTLWFTDISTGHAATRQWTFSGGKPYQSTDSIVAVVYDTLGSFSVKLEMTNAGGTDDTIAASFVQVKACGPPPIATFQTNYVDTICEGDTIQFTDLTAGPKTSRLWTFSGGLPGSSGDSVVRVAYPGSGSFSWSLQVSNAFGTDDTLSTQTIDVKFCPSTDPPSARFITSDTSGLCERDTVIFTDRSTGAVGRLWTFQGGSPSSSSASQVAVVFPQPGIFDVTLVAINPNGSDTTGQYLVVNHCFMNIHEDQVQRNIQIFPNPFQDHLTLEAQTKVSSVQLLDSYGRSFPSSGAEGNRYTWSTEHVAPGLYLLQVRFEDGREEFYRLLKR